MQSQNANSSTGANGSDRLIGAHPLGSPPESLTGLHGFGEALVEGGGSKPKTPEPGAGTAFNLLGLPPSPPPRSGVTGASAWGFAEEGGVRGGGDVMAGQVRPVLIRNIL